VLLAALTAVNAWSQGIITTIAGADFSFPAQPMPALGSPIGTTGSVAVDNRGTLYIADLDNNLILKVNPQGILSIAAGNGLNGFSGDGGSATTAALNSPSGIAVDGGGNLYIADAFNNRIRKVTPAGIISTVAGNGNDDYTGDGGAAIAAALSSPLAVAVDASGNLYIADTGNNVIRKVTASGTITTVAGNGNDDYTGDGGPAIKAAFSGPAGIAVDPAGNLYIADFNNSAVRKVTTDGRIATIAGNGDSGFSGDGGLATKASLTTPYGVALDASGNLFIADFDDCRIRKVTPGGTISTVAGKGSVTGFSGAFSGDGGSATAAFLNSPRGVALDSTNNLLIADGDNYRIRKVAGGIISTIAGNGNYSFGGDGNVATATVLSNPNGVALDANGNVYIADTLNNRIRKITTDGIMNTIAGSGASSFSGDGGPAAAATLNAPAAVAVDAAGNVFIADTLNVRIRKITPGGIISTVAGNGVADYSGDGGQATSASLDTPTGIAVDQAGNLYIGDFNNNCVRKVTPGGIITTIAGIGTDGFSGDQGPGAKAELAFPNGVAVDASGNVFIADTDNNRIRKVTPGGIISTVAGNGNADFSGDGGQATGAALNGPEGVFVDRAGNLFIADTQNHKIRKVTPAGIISTVAGKTSDGDFSGDGGPATEAELDSPEMVVADPAGNMLIADTHNDRIRAVLIAPPAVLVSPSQLQFAGASGGSIPPAQNMLVDSLPGLATSLQVSADSAAWLHVSLKSGAAPLLVEVTADPTNLQPGTYAGTITITTPSGAPSVSTVNVSFAVSAALPPKLAIDKESLSFPFLSNGKPRSQPVTISNTGSGVLPFTAVAQTTAARNWLTVTPASGKVPSSTPAILTVTADPTGLPPGTYAGVVTIAAGADSRTVSVTMTINNAAQAILLSQSGLSFLGISQGGVVPPQAFGVSNLGTGVVNWTVKKSTLSGGPDWLQLGTVSGSTDASAATVPTVTVNVNAAILPAGRYYGLVEVDAQAAANSPQFITIFLQVLAVGSDIGVVSQPSELLYAASAANGSPGSQDFMVYNLAATPKAFRSAVTTEAGIRAVILPAEGTVNPQAPQRVTVQPYTDGATPGVYQGVATLRFSDGRVGSLRFSVVVPSKSAAGVNGVRAAAGCTPTQLLTALTTLGQSFAVSAGFPVALGIDVKDDCGTPLDAGSVRVSFSNGDAPLTLQSLKGGHWAATWQTSSASAAQVVLKIQAADSQGQLIGTREINGQLQAQTDPPVFAKAGIVSAASLQSFAAIAPGGIISIFGDRLADNAVQSGNPPLPPQLGSTTVIIGGQVAPLFYVSQTQVNALVPIGIKPNTTYQVLVQRGLTYSQPISVDIGPAQPAAFLAGGAAIAVAYRGSASFLVSPANPATTGDVLVIYCAGLGATNPPVADGAATPFSPLSQTISPVTVSICGQSAGAQFAGLAPGFVGLYQVNTSVPAGVTPGDSVPLTLSVAGQTGPAAGLAVR